MHMFVIALRLIHIVAGSFWVGGAVLVAGFIAPAVRAVGAPAAPVMRQLTAVQKLPYWLLTAGLASILSGVLLVWAMSGGSIAAWMHTGMGTTYSLGGLAALAAALIGMAINIPTANRLGRLATMQADAARPDLASTLSRRLVLGTRAVAALLLVAVSAMAVARYVS